MLRPVTDADLGAATPRPDWTVADFIEHVVSGNLVPVLRLGGDQVKGSNAARAALPAKVGTYLL